MEKGIEIIDILCEKFNLGSREIATYSPLTLAYIGDAIYELVIRTIIVSRGNAQVNKLHHKSSNLVKAETQAKMIRYLVENEELEDDEMSIYKRGRNAKSYTSAKNASIGDYRTATGFEALMGYLYMTGKTERMNELIKKSLKMTGMEI